MRRRGWRRIHLLLLLLREHNLLASRWQRGAQQLLQRHLVGSRKRGRCRSAVGLVAGGAAAAAASSPLPLPLLPQQAAR